MTTIPDFFGRFLWGFAALIALQTPVMAEPLWEWVNPLPQGHDLISIATGGGVIVAVGVNGTILVSSDGIEWEVRAATTEYALYDVTYGGGRFVAVGGKVGFEMSPGLGVYLSSEDGLHWEERHRTDFFTPEAVNWNGSQFVTLGRAGRVLISPDGKDWTEYDLPILEWDMVDLAWDGSRYVALGYENWFTGSLSQFTSDDGANWEIRALESECHPSALTWVDGQYVAVGGLWPGQPCTLTSEDGQVWNSAFWEIPGLFRDVVHVNEEYLAIGTSGTVASSPDGYAWAFHDEPTGDDLLGLTWTGDLFVAVGEDGILLSSPDGLVWEHHGSRQLGFNHLVEIQEVVKGNGLFVGVGNYGVIVTSPDGSNWTQQPSPAPSSLRSVIWTRAGFWAVGRYGILWSPDGADWDLVWYDDTVNIFDISWNGSLFVAVGWNPSSASRQTFAATSTDGLDWAYHWLESEGALAAVEWTGSRFVAVGSHALQYESIDGMSWVRQPLDELIELRDLAWNGDWLVAIGGVSGVGPLMMTSSGDLEWEVVTPPEGVGFDFDDVLWTGDRFVAVGGGNDDSVAFSSDGVSWSSEATGTGLGLIAVGGDEQTVFGFSLGDRIIKRKAQFGYRAPPRRPYARRSPNHPHKAVEKQIFP